jgi:TetR/AcrR family transcriptional regulator
MATSNTSADRIRQKKKLFLAREQRIIETTLALLLEQSIDRVTVSKIAIRAGIGKGTVYKHFLTKNEILIRIVLDYERHLTDTLAIGIGKAENGDPGAAAKAYFQARLEHPERDRLMQNLEVRLIDSGEVSEQIEELHQLRRSNENALEGLMTHLIGQGILEDVPPHYHYLACWALAQGAVELCFNKSWNYRTDNSELMEFITNIGVTMGNRGQYRSSNTNKKKSNK